MGDWAYSLPGSLNWFGWMDCRRAEERAQALWVFLRVWQRCGGQDGEQGTSLSIFPDSICGLWQTTLCHEETEWAGGFGHLYHIRSYLHTLFRDKRDPRGLEHLQRTLLLGVGGWVYSSPLWRIFPIIMLRKSAGWLPQLWILKTKGGGCLPPSIAGRVWGIGVRVFFFFLSILLG